MDIKSPFPVFPAVPPGGPTLQWASEMSRSLNQLVAVLRNPGEGRQTKIVLTKLPTSDQGLEPGTLFRENNVVLVALADRPYASGMAASASVGSVTVTT
jgi:hypothetical protein